MFVKQSRRGARRSQPGGAACAAYGWEACPTWTIKAQVIGSKEGGGCREMWGESIVETSDRQALRLPTAVPRLPRRDGRSVCRLRPCPYVAPDRLAAVSPLGRSSAAHRDTGGRPGFSAPRRTRYGRADPRLRHPAG